MVKENHLCYSLDVDVNAPWMTCDVSCKLEKLYVEYVVEIMEMQL